MKGKVAICALKYLEPEWEQTRKILFSTGLPVFFADREGVGNMAKAFNRCFVQGELWEYEYVFFVTNVLFDVEIIEKLILAMDEDPKIAALHCVHKSDHKFLQYSTDMSVRKVPYIEWTALMVRSAVFTRVPLMEECPYWYFDLAWSHEVSKGFFYVAVHGDCPVHHSYLRNSKKHTITLIREQLRSYWTLPSQQAMAEKYGAHWMWDLWRKYD